MFLNLIYRLKKQQKSILRAIKKCNQSTSRQIEPKHLHSSMKQLEVRDVSRSVYCHPYARDYTGR